MPGPGWEKVPALSSLRLWEDGSYAPALVYFYSCCTLRSGPGRDRNSPVRSDIGNDGQIFVVFDKCLVYVEFVGCCDVENV